MGHQAASNYISICFLLDFMFVRLRFDIKIAIWNLFLLRHNNRVTGGNTDHRSDHRPFHVDLLFYFDDVGCWKRSESNHCIMFFDLSLYKMSKNHKPPKGIHNSYQ